MLNWVCSFRMQALLCHLTCREVLPFFCRLPYIFTAGAIRNIVSKNRNLKVFYVAQQRIPVVFTQERRGKILAKRVSRFLPQNAGQPGPKAHEKRGDRVIKCGPLVLKNSKAWWEA